jgi:hypothetical protein
MAAALDRFLRTGQLGPLILGMDPNEVRSLLGRPEAQSRKLNPLLLKYGPLELAFISAKTAALVLVQMSLSFGRSLTGLPEAVSLREWGLGLETTTSDFNRLLRQWSISPIITLPPHQMILPSGVRAVFEADRLKQIGISRRDADENRAPDLASTSRESSSDIRRQLAEAHAAMSAGFVSAALMLMWGALEAAMRNAATRAGVSARIGVQPSALIRELYALRKLTSEEVTTLERARQLRTSVAHGVGGSSLDPSVIHDVDNIARRLLEPSE